MSAIAIMLLNSDSVPDLVWKEYERLGQQPDMDFIRKRHAIAEFCRAHGKTREELVKGSVTDDLKYAMASSHNEDNLYRVERDGKEAFIGIYKSSLGWCELRSVSVAEVDTDRPWTIIKDEAEPHREQVIYLDGYVSTGWNNYYEPLEDGACTTGRWTRTCNCQSVITEEYRFPGGAKLVMDFFPKHPDGHAYKAFWQLFIPQKDKLNMTPPLVECGIDGSPDIEEARNEAMKAADEWLDLLVRSFSGARKEG